MRSVLLACLVTLLPAAPAFADSRVIPTEARDPALPSLVDRASPFAGPSFAGDEVVWAEVDDGNLAVVADGPAGRREVDRWAYDPGRFFALDVAEGRAALASYVRECPPTDDVDDTCGRYMGQQPARFSLRAGPLAGSLTAVSGLCGALRPLVSASATGADCGGDTVETLEGDGAPRRFRTISADRAAIAGDVVAFRQVEDGRATVVVQRRTSGEVLLRVPGVLGDALDVAADGTVAYSLEGARVGWASPAEPASHVLDVPVRPDDVKLAGTRIAVRERGRFVLSGPTRFAVLERDGRVVATHDTTTDLGWDFDGGRLTWARRPCARYLVVAWDLAGPPPGDPGAACARAVPLTRRARMTRDGRIRLRLACPRGAAECAGSLQVTVRTRRRSGRIVDGYVPGVEFARDAGERWTQRVRLDGASRRAIRRARAAWLRVGLAVLDADRAGWRYHTVPIARR